MPTRRARPLFTFALFGVGCAGIKPVGSVDRERPHIVSADGRGPRSASLASSIELESGDLFALVDQHGNRYAGLVRVTGPSTDRFCDDSGGQTFFDAELVEGLVPLHAVAVGPVSGPLRRASVLPRADTAFDFHNLPVNQFSTPWIATTRLDLDGNGSADLDLVVRCRHAITVGLYRNGCDQVCEGTRWVGRREPQPNSMHCYGVIPDTEDELPHTP
jgi:hypothetical protein